MNAHVIDSRYLNDLFGTAHFGRSEVIGRQVAHDIVYDAAMAAFEQRRPLADLFLEDLRVTAHLSAAEIADLLRPEAYTGLAGLFVDRVAGAPEM